MGGGIGISALMVLVLSVGRIVLGIWLISAPLPLRDGARWRVPLALVLFAAAYGILSLIFLAPVMNGTNAGFYTGQFVAFSLLLISAVGFFLVIYDTSVWTALFCCTAGYTIQNLTSGATELFWTLAGGGAPLSADFFTPLRLGISVACVVVVYGLSFLLITRYLLRTGLGRLDDRSMIAMMAVVILVIIGFDLVVKWLTDHGVGMVPMLLLRLFHGLACSFILTMEFELQVRRRVEAERDTMRQVLAERERQYEQARENVAAINARVHDIRHAVGRMADADGMGHEALRELVREVKVYDLHVLTGNEALDTVLTERSLTFAREGVTLSCIADGNAISFMAPADVYALFGSVLDAAATCGGSSVSLAVRERLGGVSVHVEATGVEPDEAMLRPAHGIAERYGGTISTLTRDGAWHINLLFPTQG